MIHTHSIARAAGILTPFPLPGARPGNSMVTLTRQHSRHHYSTDGEPMLILIGRQGIRSSPVNYPVNATCLLRMVRLYSVEIVPTITPARLSLCRTYLQKHHRKIWLFLARGIHCASNLLLWATSMKKFWTITATWFT